MYQAIRITILPKKLSDELHPRQPQKPVNHCCAFDSQGKITSSSLHGKALRIIINVSGLANQLPGRMQRPSRQKVQARSAVPFAVELLRGF
jgi:hypothetical protein